MGKASRRKRERREAEEYVTLAHHPEWPIPASIFVGARVGWFMDNEERGRWRLSHFERTEEEYGQTLLELHYTAKNPEHEKARAVPPGEYVTLQRRMTERERLAVLRDQFGTDEIPDVLAKSFLPPERQWMPIMSDTPAEIIEHGPALLRARGRVLITGLGLGCLPHALLNLDTVDEALAGGGVTRIDIIEIDADVIELTGQYLSDERVHIWQGSADDLTAIPEHVRAEGWDFAWHDIWSTISSRNLRDDEAEHGISYRILFDLWAPHVHGEQAAWALEQAQMMEEREAQERDAEMEFRRKLRASTLDEQVHLIMSAYVIDKFQFNENTAAFVKGDLVPMEFIRQMDPEGGLEAHIRQQLQDPATWEKFSPDEYTEEPEPIGRPNEEV